MIQKVRKFCELSLWEKKVFLEAWLTLGIMQAAIATVSFKRLTRSLQQQKKNCARVTPLNGRETDIAGSIGGAITRAAANTPWESACLAQSLTAHRMLQRRSIPGVFYLGVMKDKKSNEKMRAHAWTQCGEAVITGHQGHEAFTVVSVFRWGQ
ncbi:MAG: lasso peptide biosynthesis B2 protein [Deltaproteobacteria bacterium]|nr:lasso peptide biosynthesis B2 protein [Deltaproteobacteria bacterium]MBW2658702.1 lasso peptide biosynthesis B2 protein [Deltaproteobacteria bacterium]